MLTLFSCPKPFLGPFNVIQRNAIQSWQRLGSEVEVILMGDDQGTSEVAKEFGIHHIPDIARNPFGTPLIRSLFDRAQEKARYDRLCYVNADIILMSNFIRAIKRVIVEMPQSLMVGRRWNLDLKEPVDFSANWEEWLLTEVAHRGKLCYHFVIDYFVYPKGIWGDIPPFAVGRPGWDIWMLYRAHCLNIPMVDLTKMVSVVHQNHDYSHHPEGWTGAMKGKEAKQNMALSGGIAYSLLDAQYCLTEKGLKRRVTPYYSPFYLYQRFVRYSESRRFLKPFVRFIKMVGDRFLSQE